MEETVKRPELNADQPEAKQSATEPIVGPPKDRPQPSGEKEDAPFCHPLKEETGH